MHPAPSVILFSTLSGLGFGFLAFLGWGALQPSGWAAFFLWGLGYALAALVVNVSPSTWSGRTAPVRTR